MTTSETDGPRRLYRSHIDKWIAGVCGGVAAYTNLDPLLIRMGLLVVLIASKFTAIVLYLVMWIIVPPAPPGFHQETPALSLSKLKQRRWAGTFLLLVGLTFLGIKLDFFNTDIWAWIWPVGVILIGIFLLVKPAKNKQDDSDSSTEAFDGD